MTTEPPNCNCKVGNKIEKYGLKHLNEEIRRRKEEEGASLRELEAYFNKRILESALKEKSEFPLDSIDEIYRTLTDEDVSSGQQVEYRNRLEQSGIDIDQVERDFVTYQTMRKHLRESLELDTSRQHDINLTKSETKIQRLLSRCEAVISQTINQLRKNDKLATDEMEILISVTTTCKKCGGSYQIWELFDKGGCQCREQSKNS